MESKTLDFTGLKIPRDYLENKGGRQDDKADRF